MPKIGIMPPQRTGAFVTTGAFMNVPFSADPTGADVFSETSLTDPNGFAGIDGIFRFLPEGPAQRVLTVFEVKRNGFRILEPAPNSFEYLVGEDSLIN